MSKYVYVDIFSGIWVLLDRCLRGRSVCMGHWRVICEVKQVLLCASFSLVTLVSFHADQSAALITCWSTWTTRESVIYRHNIPWAATILQPLPASKTLIYLLAVMYRSEKTLYKPPTAACNDQRRYWCNICIVSFKQCHYRNITYQYQFRQWHRVRNRYLYENNVMPSLSLW